jgi:molybdenum cofactor cytidylyltransferase
MLEAIVLAAGASTRMGSPKALLRSPDNRPFVVRIVDTLLGSGLGRVTVVTGPHHDAIAAACAPLGERGAVQWARNPDPGRGQLSSLLVGMDAVVDANTEALLVTLVDVPMVTGATIQRIIAVWRATRAPVVRPAVGTRHGHPVIFDRQAFAALRAASPAAGAKEVIRAFEPRIQNVTVDDEGCLMDVDTPADYEGLTAAHRDLGVR